MHVSSADVTATLPALAATVLRLAAQRERRQAHKLRHVARHSADAARAGRLVRLANSHARNACGLIAQVAA